MAEETLVDEIRERYARAAIEVTRAARSSTSCCGATVLDQDAHAPFGAGRYEPGQTEDLPEEAVLASLGCGNPLAVAELREGERVLDLGSGGGIDVLLSARRVGATGFAYGLDMTEDMLDLARRNAAAAGTTNVEFIHGHIEEIPLADETVDVVISNCVINLSIDKPAVLAEMYRVLVPGGRIGISDVVAEDHLTSADRAVRGSYVGCIAGALSRQEYLDGLDAVGFQDPEVTFTHEAAPAMHAAIIRATKPATGALTRATKPAAGASIPSAPAADCCTTAEQTSCCQPTAKDACCGPAWEDAAPSGCGCR
jgi:SAM-dependent methyltransferase